MPMRTSKTNIYMTQSKCCKKHGKSMGSSRDDSYLAARLQRLKAVFSFLLDLLVVDQDVVLAFFFAVRRDETNALVVQPLGDDTGLTFRAHLDGGFLFSR